MVALLVAINVMAVLMLVAMPMWKTAVKREREAELIWRGSQYVRAIALFQRKYANANPPNLDILLNERFLRKKYKDPMSKDGEFQLIYAADQQQRPGPTPGAGRTAPGPQPPAGTSPLAGTPLDQRTQGPAGARGGIVGVVSKSTEQSVRLFNGRGKYNEWAFTLQTLGMGPGGLNPGSNTPGNNVPGGARPGGVGPGSNTQGGRPGGVSSTTGGPGRGTPVTMPQSGQSPRPFGLPQRQQQ